MELVVAVVVVAIADERCELVAPLSYGAIGRYAVEREKVVAASTGEVVEVP